MATGRFDWPLMGYVWYYGSPAGMMVGLVVTAVLEATEIRATRAGGRKRKLVVKSMALRCVR